VVNNYATGNVKGSGGYVGGFGGIVRVNKNSNNYAIGNVEGGGNYVGGFAGDLSGGTSRNNYATGNVEGGGGMVGGFVGYGGNISESYATGTVYGKGNYVGGFAGISYQINNSYATGDVTGSGDSIGGFVGLSQGVINSYSTGKVKGKSKVGGLVGYKSNSTTVTSSYYDIETSGQIDINKGEPRSTSQMKYKSTYSRWDFDEIWSIDKDINKGYPFLKFSISSSSTDGGSSSSNSSGGSSSSTVENSSSSTDNVSSSSSEATLKIANAISLSNLPPNTKVEVYNLQGKRIYSAYPENNHPADVRQRESSVGASQILRIGVQTKGIYIVKIGNKFSIFPL